MIANSDADGRQLNALIEGIVAAQRRTPADVLKTLGAALVELGNMVERQALTSSGATTWTRALVAAASFPAGSLAAVEHLGPTRPISPESSGAVGLDLEEVIVVNRDVGGSPAVRVQSLELYRDAVSVRWAMLSDLRESPLVWDLSDDVRTEYRLVGGRGGSLGGRVWHGDVLFTPGPPADAHQLRPAVNGSGTAVPIRPLRTTG